MLIKKIKPIGLIGLAQVPELVSETNNSNMYLYTFGIIYTEITVVFSWYRLG